MPSDAYIKQRRWGGSETMYQDQSAQLQERVQRAFEQGAPLTIAGGGTKAFYGRAGEGEPLNVGGHRGIACYEPSELVLTAAAGTPLSEIEAALDEAGQMLAFEPPHLGSRATLGGAIACGLSGPRRPYAGAARDCVLGVRCINGRGQVLRFGGQVMKNVAGYDVSRLMTGALGTLGVLLDISLKVQPRPQSERTLVLEKEASDALVWMSGVAARPVPVSALCHVGGHVYVRLSGSERGVRAAAQVIGGETHAGGAGFWEQLREHTHPFFQRSLPLWRISLAPADPPLAVPGHWLHDWGGAQRWLFSDAPAARVREAVDAAGGHATLFRGGDRSGEIFHPLPAPLAALHRRLKAAFDPKAILNRGRLYREDALSGGR